MEIIVNGQPFQLPAGTTVADLMQQLNLQPRFVAVERNLQLLPRGQHAQCVLEPGDRLEVVTLVGGG